MRTLTKVESANGKCSYDFYRMVYQECLPSLERMYPESAAVVKSLPNYQLKTDPFRQMFFGTIKLVASTVVMYVMARTWTRGHGWTRRALYERVAGSGLYRAAEKYNRQVAKLALNKTLHLLFKSDMLNETVVWHVDDTECRYHVTKRDDKLVVLLLVDQKNAKNVWT